jgi:hypothetical protein
MPRFRIPTAGELLVGIILGLLLHFPVALIGNAVTGWFDNAIAEHFGLTSPSVASVVQFTWQWILPFSAAALTLVIYHHWNTRRERVPLATSGSAGAEQFLEFIPDVRVADAPNVIKLFEGTDADKLIPLLEAEKISAWARPMGPGEPPPIRVPGTVWRTHKFVFFPKGEGPGRRNQTFIQTRSDNVTLYFDLRLNRTQLRRVWPEFEAGQNTAVNRERGQLDYHVDGAEAVNSITKALNASSKNTERMGKNINRYAVVVPYVTNPKLKRWLLSRAAAHINRYSEKVRKTAEFIGAATPIVSENQIKYIEGSTIRSEQDRSSLRTLIEITNNTRQNIIPTTVKSLDGMRNAAALTKGITSELNAASSQLYIVVGELIDKINGFGSACEQMAVAAITKLAASESTT